MRPHSRLTAYQSKRFESQKKVKTYLKSFLIILDIFLVIFSLSKLSYLRYVQIKNIEVVGIRTDIANEIRAKTFDILDGAYLGIFSKANLFFYPKSQLTAMAQNIAPEIQSLSVRRNGLLGLLINVTPKQASAKVCAGLPDPGLLDMLDSADPSRSSDSSSSPRATDASPNCYLVDWSGKIYSRAGMASTSSASIGPNSNLYFVPDLGEVATSTEILVDHYATSSTEFTALQDFYNKSRDVDLDPQYILVKENGEYEMFAKDTIIYFNNQSPLQDQLQNLILFYNRMSTEKDNHFEYVDVRFGTNVFYRKK
jgi:hypothetical protein